MMSYSLVTSDHGAEQVNLEFAAAIAIDAL